MVILRTTVFVEDVFTLVANSDDCFVIADAPAVDPVEMIRGEISSVGSVIDRPCLTSIFGCEDRVSAFSIDANLTTAVESIIA